MHFCFWKKGTRFYWRPRLLPHVFPLWFHFLPAQAVDASRFRRDPQVFRTRQAVALESGNSPWQCCGGSVFQHSEGGRNCHTTGIILRRSWIRRYGTILSFTTSNGRTASWNCRHLTNSSETIGTHRQHSDRERDIKKDFWGGPIGHVSKVLATAHSPLIFRSYFLR